MQESWAARNAGVTSNMKRTPNIPSAGRRPLVWAFARSSPLLLPVVGFAGLAAAWQLIVLAAYVVHVPAAHAPTGVVGFIVVHDYSKRQELVLYFLSLLIAAACVAGAVAEWRWYAIKLFSLGARAVLAVWISALTMMVPIIVILATLPDGAFFLHRALFALSLLGTLILQIAAAKLLPRLTGTRAANGAPAIETAALHTESPRGNA